MRCANTRDYIAQQHDGPLEPLTAAALETHIADCSRCRAIRDAAEALDLDAAALRGTAAPSSDFADRLHARLQAEHRDREAAPVGRLLRHLATAFPNSLRPRTAVALISALAAIAAVLVTQLPPAKSPEGEGTYATGHLPRLTVRQSPDGRLYAELDDRTCAPRFTQKGHVR